MRIYDDHAINIDFDDRKGQVLNIVFSDMLFSRTHKYYWRQEIKEAGQSGLFITPRESHFYQDATILDILAEQASIIRKFKKVVLFGLDVAGYAAIYFSKLFRADIVVAISPMFTVDPALTRDFDTRYLERRQTLPNFTPPINREVSSGNVYVFLTGNVSLKRGMLQKLLSKYNVCQFNLIMQAKMFSSF